MPHLAQSGQSIVAPVFCLLLLSPLLGQSRIEKTVNEKQSAAGGRSASSIRGISRSGHTTKSTDLAPVTIYYRVYEARMPASTTASSAGSTPSATKPATKTTSIGKASPSSLESVPRLSTVTIHYRSYRSPTKPVISTPEVQAAPHSARIAPLSNPPATRQTVADKPAVATVAVGNNTALQNGANSMSSTVDPRSEIEPAVSNTVPETQSDPPKTEQESETSGSDIGAIEPGPAEIRHDIIPDGGNTNETGEPAAQIETGEPEAGSVTVPIGSTTQSKTDFAAASDEPQIVSDPAALTPEPRTLPAKQIAMSDEISESEITDEAILPDHEAIVVAAEKLRNDPVALNNLAVKLAAVARYDDASYMLNLAITKSPEVAAFHRNLSVVHENTKNLEGALREARNAVELDPRGPSALIQLCGLELITGNYADAVSCYETLQQISPLDISSQTFYGVALVKSGRVEAAIPILEKAIADAPDNANCVGALGMAYFTKKRYEDAAAIFKRAVELAPNRSELRYNLAISQIANRNMEGALSQYRLLKEGDPALAGKLYRVLYRDKLVHVSEVKK